MDALTAATLFFVAAGGFVFTGLAACEAERTGIAEVDAQQAAFTAWACIAAFTDFCGFAAEGIGEGGGGFFALFARGAIGVVVFAFVFVALLDTERSGFAELDATERFGLIAAFVAGVTDFSGFCDGSGGQTETFCLTKGDGAGFAACFVANGVFVGFCTLAFAGAFVADKTGEAVGFGGLIATGFKVAAWAGIDFGQAERGGGEGSTDGGALAIEEVGAAFSAEASGAFNVSDDAAKVLCGVTEFLNGGIARCVGAFDETTDLGFAGALVKTFFVATAVSVCVAGCVAITAIFDAVDDTSEAQITRSDGGGGSFAKSAFAESFGIADLAVLCVFGDGGTELNAALGVGVADAFTKARCGGIRGHTSKAILTGFGGTARNGALGLEGEFGGFTGFLALEFFALAVGTAITVGVAAFETVAVAAQAVEDTKESGLTGFGFAAELAQTAQGDVGRAIDEIFGITGAFAFVDARFVFVAEGLFVESERKARSTIDTSAGGSIAVFAHATDSDNGAAYGGLSRASVFQATRRTVGVGFGDDFGVSAIFNDNFAAVGDRFVDGVVVDLCGGFCGIFFDIGFGGIGIGDALFVGGTTLSRGARSAIVADVAWTTLEPDGGREQQKNSKRRESAREKSVHAYNPML